MKYRIRKITRDDESVEFIPEHRVFFMWWPFIEGAYVSSVVSRETLEQAEQYLSDFKGQKISAEEYFNR